MEKIVLLHGALGAASQFDTLKTILKNRFEIHTLNFDGHGDQTTRNNYSIDLFAQNLKNYLDLNNLNNVIVFGYSMGGYVALTLTQKHPEYFKKIITLGTKFYWTPESAAKEIKMLDAAIIQQKVPAFADSLSRLHTRNDWKIVLQKTADMMVGLGNGNALNDDNFRSIQTKCFIGVGDNDSMVTREETRHIGSLIPNAEFYLLENTIHPIDKLDFERVAELIEKRVNE